ncbi:hypothetical protein [Ornithinimicrobium faecis]|uniref:hypothetical protein n=1 Tax=Ornithinimicrobium faecis TaxID=2934158 RepID=UPI0021192E61|nr:hypothetical protein [Ornithinimicrobium sp. HY1745]
MFGSRRRRQRELDARLRELYLLEEAYGRYGQPPPALPSPPRPSRGPGFIALVVVAGVTISAVFAMQPQIFPDRVHELLGTTPERLLPARDIPSGPGEFSFMATQPETGDPVGYNPCEVIEVAINPDGAPADHQELVETAIEHTSDATGLQFELVGTTEDRDFESMSMDDPVLVMWADEDEAPDLADDIAGVGGSYRVSAYGGATERYVTGFVILDRDAYDDMRSDDMRQAIVDHEFGHLVGLGHVDDPRQLMHERGGFVTHYGDGDLTGLAELGAIGCS